MTRIYLIVEGRTERFFVNEILQPELVNCLLTPIELGKTGGNPSLQRIRDHVLRQLKQDQSAYCTTMMDLYALRDDIPGAPMPSASTGHDKATRLQSKLFESIAAGNDHLRIPLRFIPYIQVYEFEALLFSDCAALTTTLNVNADAFSALSGLCPEDINDSPQTAPSKRILGVHPSYSKVIQGIGAAKAIGLSRMRERCPRFQQWISRIAQLPPL